MGWLGEDPDLWAQRFPVTIDASKIDASLTDFPVALRISAAAGLGADDLSSIFDDLGANKLKIAVTLSDGTTQCYCEVAYWDHVNELAVIWVKVPAVDATDDTVLYLYVDPLQDDNTSYVNVTDVGVSREVWDPHFIAVWHLCQTPSGTDSIKNSARHFSVAHGTPTNSPTLVSGKICKALDMERGSNQYVALSKSAVLLDHSPTPKTQAGNNCLPAFNPKPFEKAGGCGYFNNISRPSFADHADWQLGGGTGNFTIEFWVNHTNVYIQTNGWVAYHLSQNTDASNRWYVAIKKQSATDYRILFIVISGGSTIVNVEVTVATSNIWDNVWNHIAIVRTTNDFKVYLNGVQKGSTVTAAATIPDLTGSLEINGLAGAGSIYCYRGQLRISKVARYTGTFTPHSDYFAVDSDTALYVPMEHAGFAAARLDYVSMEALVKYEDRPTSGQSLMVFYDSTYSGSYSRIGLQINYQAAADSRIVGGVRTISNGTYYSVTDVSDFPPATWEHLALVANSAGDTVTLYRNGAQANQATPAFGRLEGDLSADSPAIGRYTYTGAPQNYDGLLEEVRISGVARSAAWVKATYNTCFDTLVQYGTLEEAARSYFFNALELAISAGVDFGWGTVHPAGTRAGFCPVTARAPALLIAGASAPGSSWSAERPALAAAAVKPDGAWSATKPEGN